MGFYPNPIEPSHGGIVQDSTPIVPGQDPLLTGLGDAERREMGLTEARKVLATLKRSAVAVPDLAKLIKPLSDQIERADERHLAADEADRAVKVATQARDGTEAAALRAADGDPIAAAADAQAELDKAVSDAETANRLANAAVSAARDDARSARGRVRREFRENAPRLTRERLREFEEERTAAIDAVAEARRRVRRVVSRHEAVRGIAAELPEDDHLRELVESSRFDPHAKRAGTNQPNLEAVLMHMDSIEVRLGYGAKDPHRAYPVLGAGFGQAVRKAQDDTK